VGHAGNRESDGTVKKTSMSRRVLVVGGGVAGLETALALAELGCHTTLVEQGTSLGGHAAALCSLYGSEQTPAELIGKKVAAIRANPGIRVLFEAVVREVKGNVGSFHVRIEAGGKVHESDFGAIVLATGFGLSSGPPVASGEPEPISCSELERRLAELRAGDRRGRSNALSIPKNVCFVVEDTGAESAVHSASALKNALAVQKLPRRNVFLCCQNVNVTGEGLETLYREARASGVVIFKCDGDTPQVAPADRGFSVTVRDASVAASDRCDGLVNLRCDLLVLPERIVPGTHTPYLRKLLRVDVDSSDYFQQNNVWLKPTASNRKGIFFVGGCRGSFDVSDILTEARATALEVYTWLGRDEVSESVGTVRVDPAKCAVCLTCLRSCPHDAVEIVFDGGTGGKTAHIVESACQACGICVAECPAKAIQMVAADNIQKAMAIKGERRRVEQWVPN
jgi:heterodisulfide reductase subunit A